MNGYGYGATELLKVISAIQNSSRVETLNLSYCGIDDEATKSIAQFVKVNKSVKKINLTLNPISRVGFGYIMEGLKQNSTVRFIDIQLSDLEKLKEFDYFFERLLMV